MSKKKTKETKKLIDVEISLSKWLRGGKDPTTGEKEDPVLLNDNGAMCCLGFAGLACGVPKKAMLDVGCPSQIDLDPNGRAARIKKLLGRGLVKYATSHWEDDEDTEVCEQMMRVNDAQKMGDRRRIESLKKLAVKAGFNFIFVE